MELQIQNLTKRYGEKVALDHVSCTLQDGVYGLLGANGAGKSTLMNIISQNLVPDSGTIRLEPEGDILRTLGYMPQQQALYEDFSARSFLYYMAGLKKIKSPGKEIEHLLEVVNLQDAAHKRMGSYSGGMKQRVLLAQALLGNPSILLLDEPTAGLDPRERIRIRNFISEFSRDKIVLLATHVVSDIEYIASQVILLSSGKTIGIHTTGEWLDSIEGKVCECLVSEEEISQYQQQYQISNIFRESGGISLRIISDMPPENAKPVKPMLEDVYLYYSNASEADHET